MADRYWVGGSGDWNTTNTGNWAASSGGASGASAPGSADNVFFDGNSDAGAGFTVTVVATGPTVANLTVSGLDQTMVLAGSTALGINGDLTLPASGFTWSHTGAVTAGGAGANTWTTNGVSIAAAVTFNKSAGNSVTLGSAMVCAGAVGVGRATLATGGYALTCATFASSNSTTRAIDFGSSTVTITGSGATAFNLGTTTGLTLTEGTSTILMASASAKTFVGGGETYYNLSQGGPGVLTISGANTFNDIQNGYSATGATTIRLTAGVTQTVSAFSAGGSAGKLLTLDSSSAGSPATLSKASGTVTIDYATIKDITFTGGATWEATNSVDGGGNSGITFLGGGGVAAGSFFAVL